MQTIFLIVLFCLLSVITIIILTFEIWKRCFAILWTRYAQSKQLVNIINKSDLPGPIIVSVTTIPARVKFIPQSVKRFVETQTIKPDIIYLNISYKSKRFGTEYDISCLDDLPDTVVINRCDDMGAATKLVGCVDKVTDPEAMIITIDDDQIYHPNLINGLVRYSIQNSNAVVANEMHPVLKGGKHKFIEGYAGVLYKRKHISDDMCDYYKNLSCDSSCFKADDMTIGAWLEKSKINTIQAFNNGRSRVDDVNSPIGALHLEDRSGTYKKCKHELDQQELFL